METNMINNNIMVGTGYMGEQQNPSLDINEDIESQKKELEELIKNVPYSLSVALIKISQLHNYEPMDIDSLYQKILPAFPLLRRNDGSKYQSHSVHTVRSAMVSNKLYVKDQQGRYVLNVPNAIKIIKAIKIKKKTNNKEEKVSKKNTYNIENNITHDNINNMEVNEPFINYDSQNIDTSNITNVSVTNIIPKKLKIKKNKEPVVQKNTKIEKYEKTFLVLKNLLETSEGDKLLYSKLDIDLANLGDLIKLPENKLNDDKMVGMLCVFKFFKPFLERSINSVHCQETIRAKINDLSYEFQNMENMYKIDEE
jgi:hypothetical protein